MGDLAKDVREVHTAGNGKLNPEVAKAFGELETGGCGVSGCDRLNAKKLNELVGENGKFSAKTEYGLVNIARYGEGSDGHYYVNIFSFANKEAGNGSSSTGFSVSASTGKISGPVTHRKEPTYTVRLGKGLGRATRVKGPSPTLSSEVVFGHAAKALAEVGLVEK